VLRHTVSASMCERVVAARHTRLDDCISLLITSLSVGVRVTQKRDGEAPNRE